MNLRTRLGHLVAALAVCATAIALVAFADRHNQVFDVSRDARHSLDAKSVEVLGLLPEPVEVLAVIPHDAPVARAVEAFFARYQRHKDDFSVRLLDPQTDLELVQPLAANLGEIVIRYQGRSERLTELGESVTTSALARLARGAERYITFLAANGERRIARPANRDVSRFARHIEERGYRVRDYALGRTATIPANTAVLVIASPQVAYSVGDLEEIDRYVAAGGNLLWLSEPDRPAGLARLGRALGVEQLPGTIVDPLGLTKLRNPAYAVALAPEAHALLEGFAQTLALPYAAALVARPNIGWSASVLARTGPEAWTETGPFEGNVGFDADDEVQGALDLALALTRPHDGGEQRVVVVGDGDFLSNTFVDNLGNREFGRRLLEWLAADDALIDIVVEPVPDGLLDLEMWQRVSIFGFFGVLLPLILLVNGTLYWWRRRHA